MSRYSVAWTRDAVDQLSMMWLAGPDREAIRRSVAAIDEVLASAPLQRGHPVHEGLWFLEDGCLRVLYAVNDNNSRVEVARVARKAVDFT
jgi:mRNA-degrading endonuclease RelE of RelBE toxin-antitoxin system